MKNLKSVLLIGFILISFVQTVLSQDIYTVKSHKVVISGTSNIHDWTAEVVDLKGSAKKTTSIISDVSITVDAKTLKSSKGSVMDGKMQEALKTQKYPKIAYKSVSNTVLSEKDGQIKCTLSGNLSISGVTKTISFTSICKTIENGNLEVSGSFSVLMSDYGVEPPTALFGSLKTADKVVVNYKIVLQK